MKNKAAQQLANIRWKNTSKKDKTAHIDKMNKARLDKKLSTPPLAQDNR